MAPKGRIFAIGLAIVMLACLVLWVIGAASALAPLWHYVTHGGG